MAVALVACDGDDSGEKDSQPADLGFDIVATDAAADQGAQDQQVTDLGLPANSGALCDTAEDCAAGDECLRVPGGAMGKKMCLASCMPGKACSVPDPVHNASVCSLELKDPITGSPKYYCLWFCLRSNKTYDCPTVEDYVCVAPLGIPAGTKICAPK